MNSRQEPYITQQCSPPPPPDVLVSCPTCLSLTYVYYYLFCASYLWVSQHVFGTSASMMNSTFYCDLEECCGMCCLWSWEREWKEMFSQQEIVICHVALCNPPLSKVKDCTVSRNVNSYRGDVRYIRTMINSLTSDKAPLCRLRKQYSCFPFTYSLIFRKRQLCSNPNSHPTFLAATSYSSSIFSP